MPRPSAAARPRSVAAELAAARDARGAQRALAVTGMSPQAADDPRGARIAAALADAGWCVERDFVAAEDVAALAALVDAKAARGELRPAAVGAGRGRTVRTDVRGDAIEWLIAPEAAVERRTLAALESLRMGLNRDLQLGLHELECHYARYASGTGYARHLDRSPAGSERVVSAVLYLNPDWRAGDGGELAIDVDGAEIVVEPRGGTLVTFLSARFEHEVRTAHAVRRSLTGWFRRRTETLGL